MLKPFVVCCCLVVYSLGAAVIQDFSTDRPPVSVWKGKALHQSADYVRDGLLIRWDTALSGTCIFGEPWKKTFAVPEFEQANCLVDVEVTEPSPMDQFCVRFMDSRREVFQWRSAVDFRKPGAYRIMIPMTRKNFRHAFGGNKDRNIDFPMRFYSCVVHAPGNSGTASVIVKKISFEFSPVKSELNAVKFDIETGSTARVLKKGDETKLRFLLRNPGSTPLPCRAKMEFRDFFGHTVAENAELTLPANGVLEYRPETRLPYSGHWNVLMRLEAADGSAFVERTRSLAYMTPAGPGKSGRPGFVFGICIPGWYNTNIFPVEAETASLCGASALRLNFRWRELERKPDEWHLAALNRIMKEYETRGMEVMPILSNPPVWARSLKNKPNSLPDFRKWRNYVGFFFRNYGDRIRFWEVWNEPDLLTFCDFSAPDYVQLQKIVREEQRKFAPHVKILTGGFAHAYPENNKNGFQEYVLVNGKEYFDIHAFHGHGGFKAYRRHVEEFLLPMRKRVGVDVPWFANETAVSAYGFGERRQAETLFKKFLYSWSAGAIGYNWYNLRNNGFAANDPEHHYGLVTFDFYPKPVYVVYNTLASVFRTMEFRRRVNQGTDLWILEFAGDGDHALAVWNDTPEKAADEPAVFRTDAESVEAVDLMGNRRKLSLTDGIVIHRISVTPEILLFRKASHVRYAGALVKGWMNGGIVPGHIPAELCVSLFNPFDEPQTVSLKADGGKEMQITGLPSEIRLASGERRLLTAEVRLKPEAGRPQNPELSAVFPGIRTVLRIPMDHAVLIPRDRKADEWDFILRKRDQVHVLFDADPGNVHRVWKGPDDLSAKIRMAQKGDVWVLKFAVTDDKHVQPHRGSRVWQGDGVQIAFSLPGQKGLWIAGLTLLADGKPELFLWESPASFAGKHPEKLWSLNASRSGTLTEYEVRIPFVSIGMTRESWKKGIRFSALINDNDGFGREGWIQISEGIATNRSAEKYPLILFEQK